MRRGPFGLPDLSALDDKLVANYMLDTMHGRVFPSGDAQHLVTAFVRSTESALRRYEQARLQLEYADEKDNPVERLRGADDLSVAFMVLQRAMRLAEGLMQSPETTVRKGDLPSDGDRDLLRRARNAIEHIDDPIRDRRAGKGSSLELEVRSDDSTIGADSETLTVAHARFGEWVRTLHELAVNLTSRPQDWVRK